MNDSLSRNLQVLWRTETIIADIHARNFVARLIWRAAASSIAVIGIAMLNVALFLALSRDWEPAWARERWRLSMQLWLLRP